MIGIVGGFGGGHLHAVTATALYVGGGFEGVCFLSRHLHGRGYWMVFVDGIFIYRFSMSSVVTVLVVRTYTWRPRVCVFFLGDFTSKITVCDLGVASSFREMLCHTLTLRYRSHVC